MKSKAKELIWKWKKAILYSSILSLSMVQAKTKLKATAKYLSNNIVNVLPFRSIIMQILEHWR
jgi:hypothetical protein